MMRSRFVKEAEDAWLAHLAELPLFGSLFVFDLCHSQIGELLYSESVLVLV